MDKEAINNRVLMAINAVLNKHEELTKSRFAEIIGIKPSTFTEILKQRMNAGSEIMAILSANYGVSATWLLTGTGEMFAANEIKSSGDPMLDRLMDMIEKKDDLIRQQAEEIGQLRAQVEQLKMKLQKTASDASMSGTANVG